MYLLYYFIGLKKLLRPVGHFFHTSKVSSLDVSLQGLKPVLILLLSLIKGFQVLGIKLKKVRSSIRKQKLPINFLQQTAQLYLAGVSVHFSSTELIKHSCYYINKDEIITIVKYLNLNNSLEYVIY